MQRICAPHATENSEEMNKHLHVRIPINSCILKECVRNATYQIIIKNIQKLKDKRNKE